MKRLILLILLFSIYTLQAQESLLYLKQEPPSTTPKVFAPGIISNENEYEFGSVFSKDGTEFFYGVNVGGRSVIRYTRLENDSWTIPKTIISHDQYGFNDPFLSPDEDELYYISDMPLEAKGDQKDHDIWYSKKEKNGWSKPINAGKNINTDKNEYYMSFTKNGTMYFSSNKEADKNNTNNFDIYASKRVQNDFQKATRLPDAINTLAYEADVFVAPDESYVIFCANRKEGLGRGDLYISFKEDNGTWTKSKNMGAPINTKNHELCPFVTQDGKYFFYTSNMDIYWVSAKILDQYR
ncbi:hypothetical protein [Aquimarina sp. 2304DJ70-9]|uniref:hypothetical protein n=1 Tax=Aquimarina penaris TaxID=3231044 RepID=UPI003461DB72